MGLISIFLNILRKKANKEDQRLKIITGYPVTSTPFVPENLKHATGWETIKHKDGYNKVGFTLAPENSGLVNPTSLEMIQRLLHTRYENYPEIAKVFKKLPWNTIAISFSEFNFHVGDSCQEFLLDNKFEVSVNSFFTYQKLSENVQATYYNKNGTQFLAGICYYPVSFGKSKMLSNHRALIMLAQISGEPYPLQDRENSFKKLNHKKYGRFCGKVGKRVAVYCDREKGTVCHMEFNHYSKSWSYPECVECLKDAFMYKWKESKESKKEAPMPVSTSTPIKESPQTTKTPKELRILGLTNTNAEKSLRSPAQIGGGTSDSPTASSSLTSSSAASDRIANAQLVPTLAQPKGMKNDKPETSNSVEPSTSSNVEKDAQSSSSPSSVSSTENLLEHFDKIESTTEYDEELDAEIVDFD